jgi:hypothetical protein
MNTLTEQEMVVSFTGQALKWGMESNWLHPKNEGQGCLSRTMGKYVIRPVARLIYATAVGVLISPVGMLYHLGAAVYCSTSDKTRAYKHLKASLSDFYNVMKASLFTGIPLMLAIVCPPGLPLLIVLLDLTTFLILNICPLFYQFNYARYVFGGADAYHEVMLYVNNGAWGNSDQTRKLVEEQLKARL